MNGQRGQAFSLDVVLAAALFTLAIGWVLAQSELQVNADQENNLFQGRLEEALWASNFFASRPDLVLGNVGSTEDLRCGPNYGGGTDGWLSDNEGSWLENCWIDRPLDLGTASPPLVSGSYDVQVSRSGNVSLVSAAPPAGEPFATVTRRMLVFDSPSSPEQWRTCLDGGCGSHVETVTLRVWRA